jgi:hypothetical protein
MLPKTLTGGVGFVTVAILGAVLASALLGLAVAAWRRHRDEPLFAGIEQPRALDEVPVNSALDFDWTRTAEARRDVPAAVASSRVDRRRRRGGAWAGLGRRGPGMRVARLRT